ncbi:MAG: diacylglycerol kinase family protein [Bacteroidota bacterium]|nr:MAG: diacylglycerol kinase family protein [Bacteroidota bacterium]
MQPKVNKKGIRHQLKSFRWAFQGLSEFFQIETKARIHLVASAIAVFTGAILSIEIKSWLFILLAIALVFMAEIINTALETVAETLPDNFDSKRKTIKDLGAGAVLISAAFALVTALLIFIPALKDWVKQ